MNVRHAPKNRSEARPAPGTRSGAPGRDPAPRSTPAGYWGLCAIATVAAFAALAWAVTGTLGLFDRIDGYPRVAAGAERSIELGEPGDRVLYYEGPEAHRAMSSPPDLDGLPVEVSDPAGAAVPLEPYETNLRYRLFDRAGEAVASFPADTPGTYQVSLADDAPAGAVVAVGEGMPATALLRIVSAAVLVLLGLAAAGAAAVAARRRA